MGGSEGRESGKEASEGFLLFRRVSDLRVALFNE